MFYISYFPEYIKRTDILLTPCVFKSPSGYYFVSSDRYLYKLTLTPVPLSEFTTLITILS
jgi:hypothetical protein